MPSRLSAFTVPGMLKCAVGLLSNLKISVECKPNQNVEFCLFCFVLFFTSYLFIAHFTVLEEFSPVVVSEGVY